jgi:hypothetical protein
LNRSLYRFAPQFEQNTASGPISLPHSAQNTRFAGGFSAARSLSASPKPLPDGRFQSAASAGLKDAAERGFSSDSAARVETMSRGDLVSTGFFSVAGSRKPGYMGGLLLSLIVISGSHGSSADREKRFGSAVSHS